MSKKVIADPTPEEWVSALDDGFVTDHAMEHPSRRFKTQRQEVHDRIALMAKSRIEDLAAQQKSWELREQAASEAAAHPQEESDTAGDEMLRALGA
jgi:hypothetical protein